MADEAYRAVFLRVHPTGKMVLSLTTEPDGKEARVRAARRRRARRPARSTSRSCPRTPTGSASATATTRARPTALRRRSTAPPRRFAPRRSCSRAWRSEAAPETLEWSNGAWVGARRQRPDPGQDDRGDRPLRARQRRAAARGRGRARRADRLPRLIGAATRSRPPLRCGRTRKIKNAADKREEQGDGEGHADGEPCRGRGR